MSLEDLNSRLLKLERVVACHRLELSEIAATIAEMKLSTFNANKHFKSQIVATREHVDLLEQTLANNRRNRRSTR